MAQRAGDPAGGVLGVPWLMPGADTLFKGVNNLRRDAAVNVANFGHGTVFLQAWVAAAAATLPVGETGVARYKNKMRDVE